METEFQDSVHDEKNSRSLCDLGAPGDGGKRARGGEADEPRPGCFPGLLSAVANDGVPCSKEEFMAKAYGSSKVMSCFKDRYPEGLFDFENVRSAQWMKYYTLHEPMDREKLQKTVDFQSMQKGLGDVMVRSTLHRYLSSTLLVISATQNFNKGVVERTRRDICKNPYVYMSLHILDKNSDTYSLFADQIEQVRSFVNGEVRMESEAVNFLDFGIMEFFYQAIDRIESKLGITGFVETMVEYFKMAVGAFGEYIKGLLSQVFDKVQQLIERVLEPFYSNPVKMCKAMLMSMGVCIFLVITSALATLGTTFANLAVMLVRLLSPKSAKALTTEKAAIVYYDGKAVTMGSESEMGMFQILMEVMKSIGKIPAGVSLNTLSRRVVMLGKFAGSVLTIRTAIRHFMFLFPDFLKDYLILTFGTSSQIELWQVTDWNNRVSALLRIKNTPKVIGSAAFHDSVKATCAAGVRMRPHLNFNKDMDVEKSVFLQNYVKIQQVNQMVHAYENTTSKRPHPWSIHVYGDPGIGKTHSVRDLITQITGEDRIYTRPIGQKFWNGYQHEKAILYDEFMVSSNPQTLDELSMEYLQLVSVGDFKPDMAAIENTPQGTPKGTPVVAKAVVTSNNTKMFAAATTKTREALNRRRRLVVHYIPKPGAIWKDGNIDVDSYTPEEREKYSWLRYEVESPFTQTNKPISFNNYSSLVKYLQMDYDHYTEIYWDGYFDREASESPEAMIEEALREAFCMPNEFSNLVEASSLVAKYGEVSAESGEDYSSCSEDVGASRVKLSKFSKYWTGVLLLPFVVGAGYIVSKLFNSKEEEEESDPLFSEDGPSNWQLKRQHPTARRNRPRPMKVDEDSYVADDFILEGHSFSQQVICNINGHRIMGFGIRKREILTYRHAFIDAGQKQLDDHIEMLVSYKGKTYHTQFDYANLTFDADSDIAVLEIVDKGFPEFKDITKAFITDMELRTINEFNVRMSAVRGTLFGSAKILENRSYVTPFDKVTLEYAVITNVRSQKGDCGSVVQVANGDYAGKIVGIHVAGSTDKSSSCITYAVPVTREYLSELLANKVMDFDVDQPVSAEGNYGENLDGEVTEVSPIVYVPSSTSIKPSVIAPFLPWETSKQTAILSQYDKRAKGVCPKLAAVERMTQVKHPQVDGDLVLDLAAGMSIKYDQLLNFEGVGRRPLTFEEACKGIPGKLSSIKVSTSLGYPLCRLASRPGKKEFVRFDENGNFEYEPHFEDMVNNFIDGMATGRSKDQVWLGFLKDEVVKPAKIDEVRTRVIWCGDFTATIAFRMKFGAVLAAFNNSSDRLPPAIGLNQYSYDLDKVYEYIKKSERFIAGDYKDFDHRYHPVFQKAAYLILTDLFITCGATREECEYFFEHETKGQRYLGQYKFKLKTGHFSGSLFTTIVNCLVNELYHRYVFHCYYPGKEFDDYIGIKTLGDDHLLSVSEKILYTGPMVQIGMEKIGQVYTDDKKSNVIPDYVKWEDVTFLGVTPRKVNGLWCGAMLKNTLENSLLWTKDNDRTIVEVCRSFMEFASIWDEEYYNYFSSRVKEALFIVGRTSHIPNYRLIRRIVANRMSAPESMVLSNIVGEWYNLKGVPHEIFMESEGPSPNSEGNTVYGLTTIQTMENDDQTSRNVDDLRSYSLNQPKMDIKFATDSMVFREAFDWSSTDNFGTVIKTISAPTELLSLEATNNIQNMPFQRFIYWHGKVRLAVQVNGNPFQQGLLVLFWYPLSQQALNLNVSQWTQCEHVTISPNKSTTTFLEIPFRYPRNALNTLAVESEPAEDLGTFGFGVLSPLTSLSADSVSVTVYSSFPESEFTLPRPVAMSSAATVLSDEGVEMKAEGNSVSTTTYNIENVAGSVPIQNATRADAQGSLEASVIPMDNPPITGGSVPMHNVFPSLAKSHGIEPTTGMSLHPEFMSREHRRIMEPEHTKIDWIMQRRAYLNKYSWTTADTAGTSLIEFDLNSWFGQTSQNSIPASLGILNMFMFWRADLEFEVLVVRTGFQSGRLRATVGYGTNSIGTDSNIYFNQILDFKHDVDRCTFRVNYNQATEFIRTFEGGGVTNPIQDYALGRLQLSVANVLQATSTVSTSVDVLLFLKLDNVKVCMPRPVPYLVIDGSILYPQSRLTYTAPSAVTEAKVNTQPADVLDVKVPMQSEAEEVAFANASDLDVVPTQEAVDVTQTKTQDRINVPCKLELNRKFEFCVSDLMEVARRYEMVPISQIGKVITANDPSYGNAATMTLRRLRTYPFSMFASFYAGWAGTLKFRIIKWSYGNSDVVVWYPFRTVDPESKFDVIMNAYTFRTNDSVQATGTSGATYELSPTNSNGTAFYPIGYQATEQNFPLASQNYIDVSLPFGSHYNFVQNLRVITNMASLEATTTGLYTGFLTWSNDSANGNNDDDKVYFAMGDDANFGIWRPPLNLLVEAPGAGTGPTGVTVWFGGYQRVYS